MFRCENKLCGKLTEAGQPTNRVTVETRQRTYENVIKKGRNKERVLETAGFEIVKEISVCPDCFTQMTGDKPIVAVKVEKPKFQNKPKFRDNDNKRRSKRQNTSFKKPIVEVVKPLGEKNGSTRQRVDSKPVQGLQDKTGKQNKANRSPQR